MIRAVGGAIMKSIKALLVNGDSFKTGLEIGNIITVYGGNKES